MKKLKLNGCQEKIFGRLYKKRKNKKLMYTQRKWIILHECSGSSTGEKDIKEKIIIKYGDEDNN